MTLPTSRDAAVCFVVCRLPHGRSCPASRATRAGARQALAWWERAKGKEEGREERGEEEEEAKKEEKETGQED